MRGYYLVKYNHSYMKENRVIRATTANTFFSMLTTMKVMGVRRL